MQWDFEPKTTTERKREKEKTPERVILIPFNCKSRIKGQPFTTKI